jgi:hypothetical protein
MTGATRPPGDGTAVPSPPCPAAGPAPDGMPVLPEDGTTGTGETAPAYRHAARPATRPVTGKPQRPCSHPPKPRPPSYDHKAKSGPGRATRPRTSRAPDATPVRLILPGQPLALPPAAARVLLRILLAAHAEQTGRDLTAEAAPRGQEGNRR